MSVTVRRDVVIIGGGAMGAATAWHLAGRGREVTLLEQFGPGHTRGASHGATRNFNTAYTDPSLQRLVQEAERLWREVESESATTLLDLVGMVNHGAGIAPGTAAALRDLGVSVEEFTPAAAQERWPGFTFDTQVLHLPGAGRVRAADALTALHAGAQARGCQAHFNTPVLALRRRGELVEIITSEETYLTGRVVVTAGAWTGSLLTGLVPLPRLRVTAEQPSHFTPRHTDPWPSFNHFPLAGDPAYADWPGIIYGMLTPGEGVKAGWHRVGPVIDPNHPPGPLSLLASSLRRYAQAWLPGVDPTTGQPVECMYTSTPDSRFVLARHGPIVVGTGFAGEGFKFTPAIGRILADLVEEG